MHARVDRINPFEVAEAIALEVADANLVAFADGGHLLLGHHAQVREQVTAFLRRQR